MTLLPAYMSELYKSYETMKQEDREAFNVKLLSADPLECHVSVLPFLAWEADINIDELDVTHSREIIVNAMQNFLYAGTVFGLKNIFNSIGGVDIEEYFSQKPYYIKSKIVLEKDIPSINKYAYFIERYKNARTKYELEFDLNTQSHYVDKSASNVAVDFFNKFELEKEFHFVVDAKNSFHSGFDAKLAFEKVSNYVTSASSTFDVETSRDFFDVDRLSDVKNQAIANMRLDFSYNESDVMHLPIPPVVLNTYVSDRAVAIFDMDFTQNSSDVFHLSFNKNYEALGGVDINNYGVMDMEFYESGINVNTTSRTLLLNASSVNLNI